jgi:hypothetical protein
LWFEPGQGKCVDFIVAVLCFIVKCLQRTCLPHKSTEIWVDLSIEVHMYTVTGFGIYACCRYNKCRCSENLVFTRFSAENIQNAYIAFCWLYHNFYFAKGRRIACTWCRFTFVTTTSTFLIAKIKVTIFKENKAMYDVILNFSMHVGKFMMHCFKLLMYQGIACLITCTISLEKVLLGR